MPTPKDLGCFSIFGPEGSIARAAVLGSLKSFCRPFAALAPTCGSAEVNATISGDCAVTL